jgi:hypothetical protein
MSEHPLTVDETNRRLGRVEDAPVTFSERIQNVVESAITHGRYLSQAEFGVPIVVDLIRPLDISEAETQLAIDERIEHMEYLKEKLQIMEDEVEELEAYMELITDEIPEEEYSDEYLGEQEDNEHLEQECLDDEMPNAN